MSRVREAEDELRVAAHEIEKQRPGLGRELIREVRSQLARIRVMPLASRKERGEIRGRSTARFPYRIHYVVRADEILVIAIGHHRRRLGYWRDRVEEAALLYRVMPEAA